MTILSYESLRALTAPQGVVRGAADEAVHGTGIDVTLGENALLEVRGEGWKPGELGYVELSAPDDLTFEPVVLDRDVPFELQPGQFILVHLAEELNLPRFLSAEFRLRSAAARMGLMHGVAVWASAGYAGRLTLELKNVCQHHTIGLRAGDRIGHLIFHTHEPVPARREYSGKFNGATTVAGAG